MNEIKCPKCGTVFTVDETGYANIVKQVRDQEFAHELQERERIMAREKEQDLALVRQEAQNSLQAEVAERDRKIADLEARLASAGAQQDLVRDRAAAEARAAAERDTAAAREQAQARTATLEREVDRLTAGGEFRLQLPDRRQKLPFRGFPFNDPLEDPLLYGVDFAAHFSPTANGSGLLTQSAVTFSASGTSPRNKGVNPLES